MARSRARATLIPLVLVLALSSGACSSAPEHRAADTDRTQTPEASGDQPLDPRDLIGETWRLLPPYQPGRRGPQTNVNADKGMITFADDATWAGSDGCNGEHGTFRLLGDRLRLSSSGVSTLIGCGNLSPRELLDGTFISLRNEGKVLVATDLHGNVVAEYGR